MSAQTNVCYPSVPVVPCNPTSLDGLESSGRTAQPIQVRGPREGLSYLTCRPIDDPLAGLTT